MASLIATPAPSYFLHPTTNTSTRQGILLNRNDVTPLSTPRRSPLDLPVALPRYNSNSSSNSSDGSSSNSPPRKIRFAPLPDPRRATTVAELPNNFLGVTANDSSQHPVPPALSPPAAAAAAAAGELIALTPVASASGDSTVNVDDSDPRIETDSSRSDLRPAPKKKKSRKWRKRLFGSLLNRTNISNDDGSLPPSDSTQSHSHSRSHSLTTHEHAATFPLVARNKAAVSTVPAGRGRASLIGLPLTLTRSADGGPTAPVRQQRMLNGRVYGARHSLPNMNKEEPVFVEWGFGGMGAVDSSGGSQYARLQSANKLSLGTEASTAQEDDGSGMAWVAMRRAAREEKARKEKEAELEAERAKQASNEAELVAAATSEVVNTQQVDKEDVETRSETPTAKLSMHSPSRRSTDGRPPDATSPSSPVSPTSDHEEHHTVKTISVPSLHARPSHSRNQSIPSLKERPTSHTNSPGSERESEHGSTTEEDEEDSETELEEEAEEGEEGEEEERKTALCAGMEKVSRHS